MEMVKFGAQYPFKAKNYPYWLLNTHIGSTFLPPPPLPCPAPVGEGRIPAGWGLSPGRTGALSPEGRGHRLTDSLATSDQAASERERVIGHNHSAADETSARSAEVSGARNTLFSESRN